eukprot:Tbor_TRINITY_DN6136_c2_g9::TRINITY_DN6136_c2_g9_i1::g.21653::m.21653
MGVVAEAIVEVEMHLAVAVTVIVEDTVVGAKDMVAVKAKASVDLEMGLLGVPLITLTTLGTSNKIISQQEDSSPFSSRLDTNSKVMCAEVKWKKKIREIRRNNLSMMA